MTLEDQIRAFTRSYPEVVAMLHRRLDDPHVRRVALDRLQRGHAIWGDRMFNWPVRRLIRELDEELADAAAYSTALIVVSNPVNRWPKPAGPLRPEDYAA